MAMPAGIETTKGRGELLASPELRASLTRFIRGRVPDSELDDVVQATLADAFAAQRAPEDAEELRRWVFGIAKNKIADTHRRGRREEPNEDAVANHEAEAESAPLSARELLQWAEKELPQADGSKSTLEWMLREGDGEKLEHIAEEEKLPPARVRQRVSRLRKHYRSRWAAQIAAVAAAALAILALALWAIWRGRASPGPDQIASEKVLPPAPVPDDRAKEIRRLALERCRAEEWQKCIDELDRAKAIDPTGDRAQEVQEARAAAGRALTPPPAPPPSSSEAPKKAKPKIPAKSDWSGSSDMPSEKGSEPPPVQSEKKPPAPQPTELGGKK
jgi:DNA-directed RNA polymerase specialized sigma24 family protein